jgi:ABC-type amino acid transport substrate-binding protein
MMFKAGSFRAAGGWSSAVLAALIIMPVSGGERAVLRTEFQDITPKFFRLSDGRYAGLSYELMQMIQRRSGIEFRFSDEPVPISRVTMNLERGTVDVQIGLQKTAERERTLVFGEPLYRVRTVTLVKADDPVDFSSLADLKKLGASKGTILTIWGTGIAGILRTIPGLVVDDSAKRVEDALHKLIKGRGRVLIYHNLSMIYAAKKGDYAGRTRTIDIDYGDNQLLNESYQYVVFSRNADPEIIRKVNRVIRESRSDGELERITSKYLR